MTVVVCSQPTYLPRLHVIDRFLRADVVVLLTTAQFTSKSPTPDGGKVHTGMADASIKGPEGEHRLVVPVGAKRLPLNDTPLGEDDRWKAAHIKAFRLYYAKAPHADEVLGELNLVLEGLNPVGVPGSRWPENEDSLAGLTARSTRWVLARLGYDGEVLADRELCEVGTGSAWMLALARELHATVYLAGRSAAEQYLDRGAFRAAGVEVAVHRMPETVYPQQHGQAGFVPNLSVLDLACNVGWAGAADLLAR